ncbi:MAG: UDP-N-acetylmuramoyl-tripeptide--D-alanyl-D-alanine ligase [Nitrospirae bacterium]|nr:MAG: UDP-N-acetylmuramoyl-tripeptide--D-alanyl-D-alanine ligase [Nitrospirota bacterium]
MPSFTVEHVLRVTGGTLLMSGSPTRRLRSIATDSRRCRPGGCFIALRGERLDGHRFVLDACRRGVQGVVIDQSAGVRVIQALRRWQRTEGNPIVPAVIGVKDSLRAFQDLAAFHRAQWGRPLVAITGSNGKTTTKDMTASVLGQRWRVLKTVDNHNNRIGVPQTVFRLASHHQVAVVEMGVDQTGQTTRLCEIAQPTSGVVTNIGPDHLEFFGSLERSAEAKAELLAMLPSSGFVALNADDPFYERLKKQACCRVLSFGLTPSAEIRADRLSLDRHGMRFRLHVPSSQRGRWVTLAVGGRHNAGNALAAAAVGYAMGLSVAEIVEGLTRFKPAAMRSQILQINGVTVLYDCYNANPASMKAALNLLADLGEGRRTIAVLGEMRELGAEERRFHREIGEYVASKSVSHLVACGPMGMEYRRGARKAGLPLHAIHLATDLAEAAASVRALMRPGDVLLLKGSRSARMEQVLDLIGYRSASDR